MWLREEFERNVACLQEWEEKVHSFVFLRTNEARKEAMREEELLAEVGEEEARRRCPLLGMTLAVKDNLCIKGMPATCGSAALKDYVPPYTATAVERALFAGAILMGKTNMDEFAMGSSTETSHWGATRNPWDCARVPGGSSGGSAAAVAAGMARAALGTDSGGSVRQPAALCGVLGLKPTYGTISRYGLIAYASSFDEVGILARNAKDAAALLSVMQGYDGKDDTLRRKAQDAPPSFEKGVKGLRIGLLEMGQEEGLNEEVRESVQAAARRFKEAGAQVETVTIPLIEHALAVYHVLSFAQASSNLARYHGVLFGERAARGDWEEMYEATRAQYLGTEVKRRILLGTFVLSSENFSVFYRRAQSVCDALRKNFAHALERFDLLLGPTSATTAWKLGERLLNPRQMYLSDSYTIPANLAGLPAVSIPCGTDAKGLPIGMQLIAPAYREDLLFRAALAWEELSGQAQYGLRQGKERWKNMK